MGEAPVIIGRARKRNFRGVRRHNDSVSYYDSPTTTGCSGCDSGDLGRALDHRVGCPVSKVTGRQRPAPQSTLLGPVAPPPALSFSGRFRRPGTTDSGTDTRRHHARSSCTARRGEGAGGAVIAVAAAVLDAPGPIDFRGGRLGIHCERGGREHGERDAGGPRRPAPQVLNTRSGLLFCADPARRCDTPSPQPPSSCHRRRISRPGAPPLTPPKTYTPMPPGPTQRASCGHKTCGSSQWRGEC